MAGPIRERLRANHPIIAAAIDGIRDAAERPNTGIAPDAVPAIANAVQDAIRRDPVAANAANAEPWWQSRIKIGLLIWFVTFLLRLFGLNVEIAPEHQDMLFQFLQAFGGDLNGVVGSIGLGIAAVGRWVRNLPPIDWRRPWTVFGIGTGSEAAR